MHPDTTEGRQKSTGILKEELIQAETFEEDLTGELLAEQKGSYAFYIKEVDRMLSENRGQLLSAEEGSYEQIPLSDSVEYWET